MRHIIALLALIALSVSTIAQHTSTLPWTSAPSPKHEVRAVWLTTVNGLDWPRTSNQDQQQRDLIAILDQLQDAGINTVLVQARVRATTIYPSVLEPWDGNFSGTPGVAPKYNPLQLCIDECHKRGMECHAWIVTLPLGSWDRVGVKSMRKKHPKLVKKIGSSGYMDPENPATATYLAELCREMVRNYDLDGIHLDYIRYPEQWKIKVSRPKGREYITNIVKAIHKAVKSEKPWVKLSCAPIGKHDNLAHYPAGGWNARNAVCQDAQEWLRLGIMDELFPMMYFKDNNFYPFAIDWKEKSCGRIIASGLGIYFLDPSEGKWTLDMVERQLNVVRQVGLGHCYFRSRFFTNNIKGVYDLGKRFDQTPALVPPMTWEGKPAPTPPQRIALEGNTLTWNGAQDRSGAPYLTYNVYASKTYPVDVNRAENLVATRLTATSLKVPSQGLNYAVTAMDRYGQESRPAELTLNRVATVTHTDGIDERLKHSQIPVTDGRPIAMPDKGSTLDAEYVIIENIQGRSVAVMPWTKTIDVSQLKDGIYQVRSLGRKGRNHRLGFFAKRTKAGQK
jgi:uncharacterized lipoprotein YddW (UPF0748 family)